MEKTISNNKGFNVEKLLEFMIKVYMGKGTNLEENKIHEFYSSMIKFLNITLEKNEISKNLYDEMREIIDKYYNLMQKPEILEMLRKGNISKKDLLKKVREEVLGDNKRIYSMSDLCNREQFLKAGSVFGNIKYEYKPAEENEYINREGSRIRIRKLGELSFIHANGVVEKGGIYKYRIQRETSKNIFSEYNVYTKIPTFNMSNPEYKEAVLEELLSTRNILLSDANGYIGEILVKPQQEGELEEEKNIYGYSYRVNDSCVLRYDAADLTAVVSYVNEMNKIMSKNANKNDEIHSDVLAKDNHSNGNTTGVNYKDNFDGNNYGER